MTKSGDFRGGFKSRLLGYVLSSALALAIACPVVGQSSERFAIVENADQQRIDILVDGKLFTSYLYSDKMKKPVLYPLLTAEGTPVTRGWPLDPRPGERVDHPHHVGMWLNYGDVNGLDFWNNSPARKPEDRHRYGTIRHREVKRVVNGNERAILEVTTDWQKPDGDNLLREDTRYVFSGTDATLTIERISTLTALEEVSLHDNKEGLLGIRVARQLEHPSEKPEIFTDASGIATPVAVLDNEGVTGQYRSSEGKTGDDVWGTRARWVILDGILDKKPVSLVILDHPQNVGYPTYWHARGYGLFAANPLGQKEFSKGREVLDYKLSAGESVTFRYKVLIHSGSHLTDAEVERASTLFSKSR